LTYPAQSETKQTHHVGFNLSGLIIPKKICSLRVRQISNTIETRNVKISVLTVYSLRHYTPLDSFVTCPISFWRWNLGNFLEVEFRTIKMLLHSKMLILDEPKRFYVARHPLSEVAI